MELVVVVFVLGTIAAIAAPRFGHAANSYRLEAAVKRVEMDLEYASRMARAQSRTIEIRFDPDEDTYTLIGVRNPVGPGASYTVRLGETPYGVDLSDAKFAGGQSEVLTINGHGAIVNKGVIRIGLGPNARLLGFASAGDSPVGQAVVVEVVEPKKQVNSVDVVVPGGFLEGN